MAQFFDNQKNTLERRWFEIKEKIFISPMDRVLDMGCAEGWISVDCAQHAEVTHGFDLDRQKIAKAKKFEDPHPLRRYRELAFSVHDIRTYNFPKTHKNQYDIILCLGVLHKLTEEEQKRILVKIFNEPARLICLRAQDKQFRIMHMVTRLAPIRAFSVLRYRSRYAGQGDYYICHRVKFPI